MEWGKYISDVMKALESFSFDPKIISVLRASKESGKKIFIAGNGGSAAIASHYACDLSKGANKDWLGNKSRFKVVNLVADLGYITAIANDNGYDEVFNQQLVNLASKGDLLVLISSSGNSPNIIRAAERGRGLGMAVIGITGFDGGKLKKICDYSAHIELGSYEVCEDVHNIFGHFLACCLKEE